MDAQASQNTEVSEDGPLASPEHSSRLVDLFGMTGRHIALLAAWIAMSGSLFFSEALGWPPCVLCWYQRILMYPLTLILAIGIWRRDRGLHLYVLPFSIIGAFVSLYHYLLIKTDWFPPPPCAAGIPCTVDYLDWFGFINIPFMALMAFLIITGMMIAWDLMQPLDEGKHGTISEDDVLPTATPVFDGSRLAVIMISVGVALTFVVASTFV